MKKQFFVMINNPRGGIIPLVDLENEILLFDSRKEAKAMARRCGYAEVYGWHVYEREQ